MTQIFDTVYLALKWLSKTTGLSYHEINIIIFYIVVPAIFIYFIDKIYKTNFFKIVFITIITTTFVFVPDFEVFATKLFNKSVAFLNWFGIIGLNYIQASVIICVFIPILIIILLKIKSKLGTKQSK